MKISILKKLGVLALVTAWLGAIHQLIPAQSTNGQQQVIADSSAGTSANTAEVKNSSNAELLKELQQMRARIEQLEAQLKAQSARATESSSQQAQPAVQNVSLTASAKPAPAQTGDRAQPQKPEPAAPFAYADWTWLNGTPRNKDAVWDSKFFTPEIRFDTHFIHSFNNPR